MKFTVKISAFDRPMSIKQEVELGTTLGELKDRLEMPNHAAQLSRVHQFEIISSRVYDEQVLMPGDAIFLAPSLRGGVA